LSRNPSGVYSLPNGSIVANGETAVASQHNTPLQDLEADMNIARPIVAGGTGATSASDALTNLGAMPLAGGSFTGAVTISSATPAIFLSETDGDEDFNQTRISQTSDTFDIRTLDSTGTLAGLDYKITKGATGASLHQFYIGGTEAAIIEAAGTSISDPQAIVTREKGDLRYTLTGEDGTMTTLQLTGSTTTIPALEFAPNDGISQITADGFYFIENNAAYAHLAVGGGASAANSVLLRAAADARYVRDVSAGAGITVTGTVASFTVAHSNTSSIADSDNSGGVVLQDMTWDTYGHALTRATVDLDNRYVTLSGGSTITGNLTVNNGLAFSRNDGPSYVSVPSGQLTVFQQDSTETARIEATGSSISAATAIVTREKGDSRYAQYTTSSSASLTDFPVGEMVMVFCNGRSYDRNAAIDVKLSTANTLQYVDAASADAGTDLTGTWRSKGAVNTGGPSYTYMAQRVA
jgi:hypothetical protein